MKKIIGMIILGVIIFCGTAFAKEGDYLGIWIRQATYSGGQLVSQEPATLILKSDSFTSNTAAYANSGKLSVSGDQMTMLMTQSNCPGVQVPMKITYTYSISEDGKTMTFVTGPVKEIYKRK